ncbi:MAG: hypothetical protein BWZ02_01805 [Lentisphaerae bacterium ADurb.BinA184]|nr:MAG: hypothetical protein BWZ02_01805 [Lentisphaerae bacterium ADurb.BinA184]
MVRRQQPQHPNFLVALPHAGDLVVADEVGGRRAEERVAVAGDHRGGLGQRTVDAGGDRAERIVRPAVAEPDGDRRRDGRPGRVNGADQAGVLVGAAVAHPAQPGIVVGHRADARLGSHRRLAAAGFAVAREAVLAVARQPGLPLRETHGEEQVVAVVHRPAERRMPGGARQGFREPGRRQRLHTGMGETRDRRRTMRRRTAKPRPPVRRAVARPHIQRRPEAQPGAGGAIHDGRLFVKTRHVLADQVEAQGAQTRKRAVAASPVRRHRDGVDAERKLGRRRLGHAEELHRFPPLPVVARQDERPLILPLLQAAYIEADTPLAGPRARRLAPRRVLGRRGHLGRQRDRLRAVARRPQLNTRPQSLCVLGQTLAGQTDHIGTMAVNHIGRRQDNVHHVRALGYQAGLCSTLTPLTPRPRRHPRRRKGRGNEGNHSP